MAPRIGRRGDAVVAFFHLYHHHLDGDDGIVHKQSQSQDQRAQRDAVEVLSGRGHHNEDCRQRQRHSRSNDDTHTPAHAHETHQHDHQQRDKELDHELIDRRADIDGLVCDLGQAHTLRHVGVDRTNFPIQRLAQIEPVPTVAHDDAEQQCGFSAVADHESRRVLIATLDRGNVRQFQCATLRHDRRIADLLQFVESAVQANKYLRTLGFHGASRR